MYDIKQLEKEKFINSTVINEQENKEIENSLQGSLVMNIIDDSFEDQQDTQETDSGMYIGSPSVICKFFNQGTCKQGSKCNFKHPETIANDKECGICMEPILKNQKKFGLLNNCSHSFCLDCIRVWRSSNSLTEREENRTCPKCKVFSKVLIPSTKWIECKNEKSLMVENFKYKLKLVDCKYQNNSNKCPQGKQCQYKHGNNNSNNWDTKLSDWIDE